MSDLPPPLTPPECDLRDYPGMMVDVARVRDSGLASDETPEACWAAFLLWCAAWHQVPAGSIPNNDQWIAKQAGYAQRGRIDTKAWGKVREGALRGFVKCSDGLLYHPVVAEKALEAWLDKLARMLSSGAGNAKRWNTEFDPAPIEAQIQQARDLLAKLNPQSRGLTKRRPHAVLKPSGDDPAGNAAGIPAGSQENGMEGNRREGSTSAPIGAGGEPPPPPPPATHKRTKTPAEEADARLWRDLKVLFVERDAAKDAKAAGVLLGALASKYGNDVFKEAARTTLAADPAPVEPHSYLVGLCETAAGKRQPLNRQEAQEQRNRQVAAAWRPEGVEDETVGA